MKWIGKRISFVDHTHKTTVIIDPEKKFWVNTLMGAWLAMWWVIGATLTWAFNVLILNNQEKIILFVQGGFIFLFFYFFIFGAFIAYIYKIKNHIDQDMKDKKISLQLILYLNYLTFSVPHFRDGIIVSNKSFIQATIFFLILLYINRKQFKKNESINYNCD